MALKHSKFRNPGILFELLVRQTTADLLQNIDSKAVKIIKKKNFLNKKCNVNKYVLDDFYGNHICLNPIELSDEEEIDHFKLLETMQIQHLGKIKLQKYKDKLNIIPGVEVLKILSRYRFFVGIGKLFDFTEVRKNIENEITPKEI